ncbi:calpain-1 catalytic subunit-like [Mobula birostris]|uniref:calpain-1 catalytic subunit-like n=1 Tax=Mobula birostris TaxID=1983395 RepID=UPI003B28A4B7
MFLGVSGRIQQERLKQQGMGTNEQAVHFLRQDYQQLKEQCREEGTLFQDSQFPAAPTSIGYKELGPHSSKTRGIEWMRQR